jgi:cytochrome oxidase assembly protein ShyY1
MHPELRYFTGTIPIWFHFVLAAFLYTLGRWQVRRGA